MLNMDNREIRYINTVYLRNTTQPRTVSGMADKLGKSVSQTSAFAGDKAIKPIGDRIARQIESAYGKSSGWLDVLYSSRTPQSLEDRADRVRDLYMECDPGMQAAIEQTIEAALASRTPPHDQRPTPKTDAAAQ